jgi:2-dehydro-3-deoxygluconokinase
VVDVMIGNEEDFTACLGFEVEGLDAGHSKLEVESFHRMMTRAAKEFPNLKSNCHDVEECKGPHQERLGRRLFCARRIVSGAGA